MQTWFYRLPPAARALMTAVWVFAALFGVTQLSSLDAGSDMSHNSVAQRLVVAAVVGVLAGVFGVVLGEKRIRRVYGSTEQAITADGHRGRRVAALARREPPVDEMDTGDRGRVRGTRGVEQPGPPVGARGAARRIRDLVPGLPAVLRRRILRLASAIDQRERAAG
jgi:hypothetical protein